MGKKLLKKVVREVVEYYSIPLPSFVYCTHRDFHRTRGVGGTGVKKIIKEQIC